MAYKCLILQNSTDEKSPTLVGPTLIHMSRSYIAFCHLAAKLREIDNGIGDLKCIVTDGEPGLIKAFQVFYLQMPLLHCNRHFRKNVLTNLSLLGSRAKTNATLFAAFLDHLLKVSTTKVYWMQQTPKPLMPFSCPFKMR